VQRVIAGDGFDEETMRAVVMSWNGGEGVGSESDTVGEEIMRLTSKWTFGEEVILLTGAVWYIHTAFEVQTEN